MKKRGHSELALFAWTLSKGDNNPWRCLMAKRQRFTKEFKVERFGCGNPPVDRQP